MQAALAGKTRIKESTYVCRPIALNEAVKLEIICIPCDPEPEVIGLEPFEILINGTRIKTREHRFNEAELLHVPAGISWHPLGWSYRCARYNETVSGLIRCSEDSRLDALQKAWEDLKAVLNSSGEPDRSRPRLKLFDTGVIGVSCSFYLRNGAANLTVSVNFPKKGGGTVILNKGLGKIDNVTEEAYSKAMRRAISIRRFVEHCMREKRMFVERVAWNSKEIPLIDESHPIKPSLKSLKDAASHWAKKRMKHA